MLVWGVFIQKRDAILHVTIFGQQNLRNSHPEQTYDLSHIYCGTARHLLLTLTTSSQSLSKEEFCSMHIGTQMTMQLFQQSSRTSFPWRGARNSETPQTIETSNTQSNLSK